MEDKKCTWSQHPKWFLERRADPANKDLTDLEISQQYTAENMTVVEDKPSFDEPCPDQIFVECWDRVMGDNATIEEKKVSIGNQITKSIVSYGKWNSMPSAILMHPNYFRELSLEMSRLFNMDCDADCPAGSKFRGIPIYRTTDVETFKVL